MEGPLLKLKEFESKARDRKNSNKRKAMIDDAVGPAIAVGVMAAAGAAVKAGAFKLKDEVYSGKEAGTNSYAKDNQAAIKKLKD